MKHQYNFFSARSPADVDLQPNGLDAVPPVDGQLQPDYARILKSVDDNTGLFDNNFSLCVTTS